MKKFLMVVCAAILSTTMAFADQGGVNVGVNLAYPTEQAGIGVGLNAQYGVTDHWRGEVAWTNFFEHKNLSEWDLDFNIHYLVALPSKFTVYPLVGIHYDHFKWDANGVASTSDGYVGFNIGAGLEYQITDSFSWNVQCTYNWNDDYDQAVIRAGVKMHF